MPPKQKARVGVRLKEAIGGSKSINRSADLDALVEKFNVLRTKLKNLIVSLKAHHASMQQLAKTRMDVANNIAMLSEKTPVHESAGLLPSPENSKVVSYRSVHMDFSRRSSAYADKYNQFIVDYAIEWDKVIYNRVSTGIKEAEKLRRDLDHYQGKVESLRQSTNKTLASGKQVDSKTAEKLSRNEDKLIKAKEHYNRFATDMCILIEEVTDRAWKDLHPMLIKLAQFDSTMANDESKALSQLNQVVTQLKTLADQHGLTPQARLKDLAERKPSEISTAKSGGGLALESGSGSGFGGGIMGGGGGLTSSIYGDSPSMPPGSVSPQGIGGFPVAVADTNGSNQLSRASSQSSFGSGVNSNPGGYSNYNLTTSDMMAIGAASAPPPSMEQVQDATSSLYVGGGDNRARTASGNSLPPLGPGYRRSSSILSVGSNDTGSMTGSLGPPAPAPAAPPPPPPTSSTGLSMYGGYGGSGDIPMATAVPTAPESPAFGTGAYGSSASAPPHPWSSGGGMSSGTSNPYGAPPPAGAPPRRSSSNPFDDDLPEF